MSMQMNGGVEGCSRNLGCCIGNKRTVKELVGMAETLHPIAACVSEGLLGNHM
jgi:hypothetical protein